MVLALIAGVVGSKVRSDRAERYAIAAMTSGGCEFDRRSDPGAVNEHADNPTFQVDPPSGGVHEASAASPGVYTADSLPPEGRVVHALEHGDIAVWYRPDLAVEQIDLLTALVDAEPDVLVLPRVGLDRAVAVVAWHKRLLCDTFDMTVVRQFVDRYADKGPENQPE